MKSIRRICTCVQRTAACPWIVILLVSSSIQTCLAQSESPIPILTGTTGYFTNVDAGQVELVPEVYPVLLIPAGDRWLVEARSEFKGEFERASNNGPSALPSRLGRGMSSSSARPHRRAEFERVSVTHFS